MAAKKHIVKINEEQYSYLKDDDDTRPYDGNSKVSVTGKFDTDTDGAPKTTDEIGKTFTPQAYTYYRRPLMRRLGESDGDGDRVNDFYNVDQANTLSDDDKDNDLTVIPESISYKLDAFLDAMSSQNLNGDQIANVMNKILEAVDFSKVPFKARKELRLKIN